MQKSKIFYIADGFKLNVLLDICQKSHSADYQGIHVPREVEREHFRGVILQFGRTGSSRTKDPQIGYTCFSRAQLARVSISEFSATSILISRSFYNVALMALGQAKRGQLRPCYDEPR